MTSVFEHEKEISRGRSPDTGLAFDESTALSDRARPKFRVLAVDDDTKILALMARVITSAGFECQCAEGAAEALAHLGERTVDLVVTDIRMPEMSGVEMAELMQDKFPDVDVVFITGYTEYDSIARAIRLQPIGFLEKPFDPQQLLTVVERAFHTRAQALRWEKSNELLRQAISEKTRELEFKSERLQREKEMMQGIISHANFGLIAVDTSYATHLLNKYAIKVLDIDDGVATSYIGMALNAILDDRLSDPFGELYKRVLASCDAEEIAGSVELNGRSLGVLAYPVVYRDDISAVIFIVHDVTEKEMLQRSLLQTAKLASIGELAAGVAHEINNPLGFVSSNCRTLRDYCDSFQRYIGVLEEQLAADHHGSPPEPVTELRETEDIDYLREDAKSLLDETLDGLRRVATIIRNLKTFARVESEIPQTSSVNDLIEDTLNLVRNQTKYKLTIERELGELPELACFPNQLVQVFTNLFINAAHAVAESGTLTIKTWADSARIHISVRDSGCGIPEHVLPRIFDPFFTTKEQGKGTGMGLSISYGIIQKHGGEITVNSKVGDGTEFVVTLPLHGVTLDDEITSRTHAGE